MTKWHGYHEYQIVANNLRQQNVRVEEITTYKELDTCTQEVIRGVNGVYTKMLILVGSSGLSKSWSLRGDASSEALGKKLVYETASATAFGLWQRILRSTEEDKDLLILDDMDDLLRDRKVIAVLKCVDPNLPSNVYTWDSARIREDDQVRTFRSKVRLAILLNELPRLTPGLRAVFSRSRVVFFCPCSSEVHRYVGSWWNQLYPQDKDVYDYIAGYVDKIALPDIRLYTQARQYKLQGRDWKHGIQMAIRKTGTMQLIQKASEIYSDPKLETSPQKLDKWTADTGLTIAMYYRYLKEWAAAQGIKIQRIPNKPKKVQEPKVQEPQKDPVPKQVQEPTQEDWDRWDAERLAAIEEYNRKKAEKAENEKAEKTPEKIRMSNADLEAILAGIRYGTPTINARDFARKLLSKAGVRVVS